MRTIDLNADVGERPEALRDGTEESIIRCISSANIACGGHAGNEASIRETIRLCFGHGVGIGAHPGYPDRENIGRKELNLPPSEIERCVFEQVALLSRLVREAGESLRHVKPHGALYNTAARSPAVAAAIGEATARVSRQLVLIGLAGSGMVDTWRGQGLEVAGEAFADRRYEPDGSLRSRAHPDALISDPDEAARQALGIARDEMIIPVDGPALKIAARTLCVHGDTPGAPLILRRIREELEKAGIAIRRPWS